MIRNINSKIEIRENKIKYVSRGGLKLEKAIQKFNINLTNLNCMDIGASTGGFTDCMLQNNCNIVYSIDVGYGQLDWKLRNDSRVVNLERTNIRYLNLDLIKHEINFFSIDVSFISLKLVLPVVKNIMLDAIDALDIKEQKTNTEKKYEWYDKKYYTVPNVIGMDIKEAKKILDKFEIKIEGTGNTIIEQSPKEETRLQEGNIIRLYLGN